MTGRFTERHQRQLEVNPSQPYTLWCCRNPESPYDNDFVVFIDGGDAVALVGIGNGSRLSNPENYRAWESLMMKFLDNYRSGDKHSDFVIPDWLRPEDPFGSL